MDNAAGTIALATTSISQFANDSGYITALNGALLATTSPTSPSTSSARTNLAFTGGTGITVSNAAGTIAFSTTSVSQFTNDAGYSPLHPTTSPIWLPLPPPATT